jgi:hypothetical protein
VAEAGRGTRALGRSLLWSILVALIACDRQAVRIKPGKPPFTSVSQSQLLPHRAVPWQLQVYSVTETDSGAWPLDGRGAWEIVETRAGDVPMPPGVAWKCRFNHVASMGFSTVVAGAGELPLSREIQCSSDGWRTHVGSAALTSSPCPDAALLSLYDGENWEEVQLLPCIPGAGWTCAPAPELP